MATDEATFKGAPAEFESAVRVYDRQLGARLGVPLGTMLIFKTHFTPGVPQRLDIAEVCVAVSDLPLAEAALKPMGAATYTGPVLAWQWRATITAHALPDRRSHLFLQCEEAIWPGVEPHWQALLAELSRLGYIEAGEAELVATESAKRRPGNRHRFTAKERREICKEYLSLGGGMTQDQFMSDRYGMSGRTLRDWLTEEAAD